jgi:hypothetical protein
MGRVVYQVRLVLKPEEAGAFNTWYEGEYIPKLMRETPHFTAVRRYQADFNGRTFYVTDYECTDETLPLAIAEMRAPTRVEDNAAFYRWRDRAITLHESMTLHERFSQGV